MALETHMCLLKSEVDGLFQTCYLKIDTSLIDLISEVNIWYMTLLNTDEVWSNFVAQKNLG